MPSRLVIGLIILVGLLVIGLSLYFTNSLCSWGSWAGTSCSPSSPGSPSPGAVSENVTRLTAMYAAVMPTGCQARWSAWARVVDSMGAIAIPENQNCPSGTQDPPATGPGSRMTAAGFKTCNSSTPPSPSFTPEVSMSMMQTPCPGDSPNIWSGISVNYTTPSGSGSPAISPAPAPFYAPAPTPSRAPAPR
jgi:hypothetical protein